MNLFWAANNAPPSAIRTPSPLWFVGAACHRSSGLQDQRPRHAGLSLPSTFYIKQTPQREASRSGWGGGGGDYTYLCTYILLWTGHYKLSQSQAIPTVPDGSIHGNQQFLTLGLTNTYSSRSLPW